VDKIFEQTLEWAKCGLYHNWPSGQNLEDGLKILKLVEEKFTCTNSAMDEISTLLELYRLIDAMNFGSARLFITSRLSKLRQ